MPYSKRFERKFLLDYHQYIRLKKSVGRFCVPDKHVDHSGKYVVSSLYYDSRDWRFYREKIDGEKKRSKVRLRVYLDTKGQPLLKNANVLLEVKKRNNLNVFKNKVLLLEEQAKHLLHSGRIPPFFHAQHDKSAKAALVESVYLKTLYDIRPALVVVYVREAIESTTGPKVRITFDSNIKYGTVNLTPHDIDRAEYSLDPRYMIMEVKYDTLLPIWISRLIQSHSLSLVTFSKYCASVEQMVFKNEAFLNN